jgi:CubicO group peptidase (beta-lactamase class C family)
MRLWIAICSVVLSFVLPATAAEPLPRSTPEEQGVSSAGVLTFIDAADRELDSLHSFMLVRHGHVVTEGWWAPYRAESRHALYSLSKSFTSTAVGIAIGEGKLSLDDEVLTAFPDDAPAEPSSQLKAMRLRDLLRMNAGHQTDPPRPVDESWRKAFLAQPVEFKPGTRFLYSTSATYMASAMVQKATGEVLLDYLRPRLFEPLGIDDPTWEVSPDGVSAGGYGLSVRTEDIAKFGQLYLQRGEWKGRQLVPAEWVDAATRLQTSNGSNPASDWDQGYGYQFWRCRHGAYRGDGAFGQYCIVLPEQDAVIAITSGLKDMQAVLNLVWDKLLPALHSQPLPADAAADAKLKQRMKSLTLKTAGGEASPGEWLGRTYVFPENERKLESLRVEKGGDSGAAVKLVVRMEGHEFVWPLGRGTWLDGRSALPPLLEQPVAGCGGWTSANVLEGRLCFYETPFVVGLKLEFAGDEVKLKAEPNVGFGGTKPLEVTGRAQ